MKRLKIILQSKYFYVLLFFFITFYVILFTKIIKYETKINNFTFIDGIVTDIDISNDKVSFILKSSEKIKCVYYGDLTNSDLLGKKIKVYGKKGNLYNNTTPNTFNYKKYLYNNKIYINYNVSKIEILKDENIFYKIKNYIIKRINNYSDNVKVYLNLFVLGDKNYLDESMYNIYRTNGIWHLFAISGMHISLLILILNKLFSKFKFKKVIISMFLLYFMFITCFSASVMRSVIFYIINNINKRFNFDLNNLSILILTAFIILLFNPFKIYNIGFIYSFIITLAIILNKENLKGNYFGKIFKISLLSFIVSLPITINNNYEINLLSIFLNIFYVPFISLIIFPTILLCFFIPKLSFFVNILINFLEATNKLFFYGKLMVNIPKLPIVLIIIYYIIIYIFYKTKQKKILSFLILIIILNKLIYKLDNNYYVYFLDVSQGDSSLIITPYKNKVIMIDTGGIFSYHISSNTLMFLKSIGINKIDTLIITHGDYDHMGDGSYIIDNFKVKKVIFNCGEYNDLEEELIKNLKAKNISFSSCINNLNINNKTLYFLNHNEFPSENDSSNVNYIKIYDYQFLFMGDASTKVENYLLEKYELNNIDVLKVGHHGSKTSSSKEFIDKVNPKYAIISVGRNNRYNHPNEEVIENLKNHKIYRTDINGTIRFKVKKNKIMIKNYAP